MNYISINESHRPILVIKTCKNPLKILAWWLQQYFKRVIKLCEVYLKINIIHHISRIKDKNHIIILMDPNWQNSVPVMRKTIRTLGMKKSNKHLLSQSFPGQESRFGLNGCLRLKFSHETTTRLLAGAVVHFLWRFNWQRIHLQVTHMTVGRIQFLESYWMEDLNSSLLTEDLPQFFAMWQLTTTQLASPRASQQEMMRPEMEATVF